MSDDINAAQEVQVALGSNRHQQIVLFIYISINGHSEERGGRGGGGGRKDTVAREGEEELAEDDGERPLSCCVSSLSRVLFY